MMPCVNFADAASTRCALKTDTPNGNEPACPSQSDQEDDQAQLSARRRRYLARPSQYAGAVKSTAPRATTMFRRAIVLHCPLCGSRRTFIRRWFGRYERCRSCGIRWNREQGFELGSVGLNFLFTFFTLAVGMVVAFVATSPDFPVFAMTIGFMSAAIVLPLFFYPFTNTLWLAVDLLAHKPDEAELADAAAAIVSASPNGARLTP